MISLSSITLTTHTRGIHTEVFNHHSTQFSEAKTTYVSKQFLEQQCSLQLGHLKEHSLLSASFSPRQTRRYQQSWLWLHIICCCSWALLTKEIFHIRVAYQRSTYNRMKIFLDYMGVPHIKKQTNRTFISLGETILVLTCKGFWNYLMLLCIDFFYQIIPIPWFWSLL